MRSLELGWGCCLLLKEGLPKEEDAAARHTKVDRSIESGRDIVAAAVERGIII